MNDQRIFPNESRVSIVKLFQVPVFVKVVTVFDEENTITMDTITINVNTVQDFYKDKDSECWILNMVDGRTLLVLSVQDLEPFVHDPSQSPLFNCMAFEKILKQVQDDDDFFAGCEAGVKE